MCARMLAGAPVATADAANDPHYNDVPLRQRLGITSYVGVPVRNEAGLLLGTLGGLDRSAVTIDGVGLATLRHLATTVARVEHVALPLTTAATSVLPTQAAGSPTPWSPMAGPGAPQHAAHAAVRPVAPLSITRTANGWRVGNEETADLTTAMVLADLLADDLSGGTRPDKAPDGADELQRLRVAVAQLEHALAARVAIEQAIGVLAERLSVAPRDAFEDLRRASRTSGRRVYDVAREIILSTGQLVPTLPDKLRRR